MQQSLWYLYLIFNIIYIYLERGAHLQTFFNTQRLEDVENLSIVLETIWKVFQRKLKVTHEVQHHCPFLRRYRSGSDAVSLARHLRRSLPPGITEVQLQYHASTTT